MNLTTLRISSSLILLLLFTTAAHCQTTYEVPFTRIVEGSCIGESLALTGVLRTTVKQTVIGSGTRIEVKESLKGSGVGLESGVKYQLQGKTTTRIILTTDTLEGYVFKSTFQCIGAGPDNNLTITYTFKQSAEGVIIESFNADCK